MTTKRYGTKSGANAKRQVDSMTDYFTLNPKARDYDYKKKRF